MFKQNHGGFGYLQPQRDARKKTLILDLDETLIHSFFEQRDDADLVLDIVIEDQPYKVFVKLRPGVVKFLSRMDKIYEVVIFTASMTTYAEPIIEQLEQMSGARFAKLYRQHCSYINKLFIKDLSKLGRPLKDCIIVDNNPDCFTFDPNNAIPIESWFEAPDDKELQKMTPILEALTNTEDVRKYIKMIIEKGHINYIKALKVLSRKGYYVPHKHDNERVSSYESPE